jgi:acetyltransferase
MRFFSTRRELPRSELARLTQIDYAREMAFIAVRSLPGATAETLGVVRSVTDPDNVTAEFAIVVRSDLKAQGLGHMLLRKMIDYLSRRGTRRLVGDVLPDNESMRKLVRSQGFILDSAASDAHAMRFVLTLAPVEGIAA